MCYSSASGQLVGLEQSGAGACSAGAAAPPSVSVAAVPVASSRGYISQVKLAYTYDGAFVGRLVFYLKANATAEPVAYACGGAGGKCNSASGKPPRSQGPPGRISNACQPCSHILGAPVGLVLLVYRPRSEFHLRPVTLPPLQALNSNEEGQEEGSKDHLGSHWACPQHGVALSLSGAGGAWLAGFRQPDSNWLRSK